MFNRILTIAALFLALAVMSGAFGAHALKDKLDAYSSEVYSKAVFYHFVHGLGLLGVGILGLQAKLASGSLLISALLMSAGIVLFSGSLYALALTGMRWLGMITPFGGVSFICAWLILAWAAWRA